MKKNKKYSSFFIRRIKGKAGSALIWALAVAIILVIVIAAGLNIVQRQQNQNVQQHIENQAYFAAMSVNRAILDWFRIAEFTFDYIEDQAAGDGSFTIVPGGSNTAFPKQQAFFNWILNNTSTGDLNYIPVPISMIPASDFFGDPDGTLTLSVRHDIQPDPHDPTDAYKNIVTIYLKSTATYYGDTASIIGNVTNNPEVETIAGETYDARIHVPPVPYRFNPDPNSPGFPNDLQVLVMDDKDPTKPAEDADGNPIYRSMTEAPYPGGFTTLQNNQNPNNGNNYYRITTRTNQIASTGAKMLIIDGNSIGNGTNSNNNTVTLYGSIETLIIRGQNTYVYLCKQGNTEVYIDNIIIYDGATLDFDKSNFTVHGNKTDTCMVSVLPGGTFRNASMGTADANMGLILYASSDPNKRAVVQNVLQMTFTRDIIVQPADPTLDIPSYIGSIDFAAGVNLGAGAELHIPESYGPITNPSVRSKTCHQRTPPISPPVPYCYHFKALNEPSTKTVKTTWNIGSFSEG